MRHTLSILIACFSFSCFAQSHYLSFSAGPSFDMYYVNTTNTGYNYHWKIFTGACTRLEVLYAAKRNFRISAGLQIGYTHSHQDFPMDTVFDEPWPWQVGLPNTNYNYTSRYINVGMTFKAGRTFNLSKTFAIDAMAGFCEWYHVWGMVNQTYYEYYPTGLGNIYFNPGPFTNSYNPVTLKNIFAPDNISVPLDATLLCKLNENLILTLSSGVEFTFQYNHLLDVPLQMGLMYKLD